MDFVFRELHQARQKKEAGLQMHHNRDFVVKFWYY